MYNLYVQSSLIAAPLLILLLVLLGLCNKYIQFFSDVHLCCLLGPSLRGTPFWLPFIEGLSAYGQEQCALWKR